MLLVKNAKVYAPEYLGKKITPKEMKLAALTMLTVPFIVLAGTGMNISE